MSHAARTARLVCVLIALAACEPQEEGRAPLTRQELLDPETCKQCHEKHYTEWAASMHAYAAKDPVFLAMNEKGQKETDGGLGDFCVDCHAPMAVREDAFENGDFTDFEQVPDHLEGVTCYFCHNVVDVEDEHNNGLVLANDTTMRGYVEDPPPVEPWAHGVAKGEHFDSSSFESSRMCGSCHDIVNMKGVKLERTYEEWKNTVFSKVETPEFARQSCIDCHMEAVAGDETIADYPGVTARARHSHLWPAVDVALDDNPGREAMESAVALKELPLSISYFKVAASQASPLATEIDVQVDIETGAGHRQPSGAAQDRRMWLEWTALDGRGEVLAQSGTVDDGEIEAGYDPELPVIRDTLRVDGEETHDFWEADEVVSFTIPEPKSFTPGSHSLALSFTLPLADPPAQLVMRLRMRPMGIDVLQDLVDSGHLDAAHVDEMPTFLVHQVTATWPDPDDVAKVAVTVNDDHVDLDDHLCKLFPDGGYCE